MTMQEEKGQSLVEVIVAIAVVGVVLVSMVLSATIGIKTSRIARDRSEARHLVENRQEEVRRERDLNQETFFLMGTRVDPVTKIGTTPEYSLTTSYTEMVPGEKYQVEVSASWMDAGNTYTVTSATLLNKWKSQ